MTNCIYIYKTTIYFPSYWTTNISAVADPRRSPIPGKNRSKKYGYRRRQYTSHTSCRFLRISGSAIDQLTILHKVVNVFGHQRKFANKMPDALFELRLALSQITCIRPPVGHCLPKIIIILCTCSTE